MNLADIEELLNDLHDFFQNISEPQSYESILMLSTKYEEIDTNCDICYTEKQKFWKCLKCKRMTCSDCFKNIVYSNCKKCPFCRIPM